MFMGFTNQPTQSIVDGASPCKIQRHLAIKSYPRYQWDAILAKAEQGIEYYRTWGLLALTHLLSTCYSETR